MARDDPTDIGQPDAGPLKLIGPMQALENTEELVGILRVKSDPVVLDKEVPFLTLLSMSDLDLGRRAGPGEQNIYRTRPPPAQRTAAASSLLRKSKAT